MKYIPVNFRVLLQVLAVLSLLILTPAAADEPCWWWQPCFLNQGEPDAEPDVEFDEIKVIIEINATDGDAGFHTLFDGEGWSEVVIEDPNGVELLHEAASGGLAVQGVTENFFESAEPLCEFDEEEPDELVVPLAEFLPLFPEGEYTFTGETIGGEVISGTGELTYNIPAAPDISASDEMEFEFSAENPVVLTWDHGVDLGEKCHDQSLVDDGTIADPALVEVVGWEVVVEPEEDEGIEPLRVLSIQLPPGRTSIEIPDAFIRDYITENDVTEFKFEVGAIEASGNQVFSEGVFEVECLDCGDEGDDDDG